ncbi:hypothetical protein GCM10010275_04400 [Streptomyces litmocidini]|nr:hypothetical protein GCM10010275_04400 [Streptomyces litmocidini]
MHPFDPDGDCVRMEFYITTRWDRMEFHMTTRWDRYDSLPP